MPRTRLEARHSTGPRTGFVVIGVGCLLAALYAATTKSLRHPAPSTDLTTRASQTTGA